MINRSSLRLSDGTERDILKNQLVMPAAGEGERPSEQQNHVEHAVDSVVLPPLNQRSRAAMDFGEGQPH